ncbi:MAG: hypothetical protein JSV13_05080 [Nitrospiraceae bacterium]|nr:MAG: hypothetical protein JSV13_05080 [Nitrospiraceae bacterium]
MEDEPKGEGVNWMKGTVIALITLCIALGTAMGTEMVYAVDRIELLQPTGTQEVETSISAGEREEMLLIPVAVPYDPNRIDTLRPSGSQEVETGIGAGEAEEMQLLPVYDLYRIDEQRPSESQ